MKFDRLGMDLNKGGPTMTIRFFSIATAALLCSACAKDPLTNVTALQSPSLQVISPAEAHEATRVYGATSENEADLLRHKTLAGKVLTAIALERVTGRAPDPARLSELD